MSVNRKCFQATIALATTICWVGCGSTASTDSNSSKPRGTEAEHRDGDGHKGGHAEHAHAEEGPHHGHLIELGQEEYHAELTHNDATITVTVYLLDAEAKVAVPIAEPEIVLNLVVDGKTRQVKLAAAPQKGDPEGQSSRFQATDAKLLDALEAPRTTGRLNVTIAGKTYAGQIEHDEHREHDEHEGKS